jgi:hypothetical protein
MKYYQKIVACELMIVGEDGSMVAFNKKLWNKIVKKGENFINTNSEEDEGMRNAKNGFECHVIND